VFLWLFICSDIYRQFAKAQFMNSKFVGEGGTQVDFTKLGIVGIEEELDVIIGTVAKKLGAKLEAVPRDELVGWARLGVTRAIVKFDVRRIDDHDRRKRVISYLIQKGYRLAYDEMRSEHVIGRIRNGKHYGGQVATTQFSQLAEDHRCGDTSLGLSKGEMLDESMQDPADIVALKDLIETVTANLRGTEREVFQMHYREGHELRDIAVMKGVTYARVYQVHLRVIDKVREYLQGKNTKFCPIVRAPK
jgi:DNA-directed RNA polymerase specialized sigma24 family protein